VFRIRCDDHETLGLMQADEFLFCRDQLWTAPELLRMTTRPINGTQKADVYSFAIVLQEIIYRAMPYFIDINLSQSILVSLSFKDLTLVYCNWLSPSTYSTRCRTSYSRWIISCSQR